MKKKSKLAEFWDVTPWHYKEVKRQTKNCTLDEVYLDIGQTFSDCIKFKVAAEELGYNAKEVGSSWGGFPSSFLLTKPKIKKDNIK